MPRSTFKLQLPKAWPAKVRSAMLHVVSLAKHAAVYTRSWAANSPNGRVRLKAENDWLKEEVALLRNECASHYNEISDPEKSVDHYSDYPLIRPSPKSLAFQERNSRDTQPSIDLPKLQLCDRGNSLDQFSSSSTVRVLRMGSSESVLKT